MYLSPVVRTLRDDPDPGETVTLLLSLATEDDEERAAVEEIIEETVVDEGGTVEEYLQFETVAVTIPQESIPAVCAIDGIASVETDDTIGITSGDAGEDLGGTGSPSNRDSPS